MASIAFIITMTDGTSMVRTAQVSDADVGRLIDWGLWKFPQDVDDKGNPIPKDVPWVVGKWISDTVAKTMVAITDYEQNMAMNQAKQSVKPIGVVLT